MALPKVDPDLQKKLDELVEQYGETVKVSDISDIVASIMGTMEGDLSAKDMELYNELDSLATYIHNAKSEIAALRPDEVKDDFLPTATDELDAIVEATADATNNIMDATEIVEGVMASLEGEPADQLMDAITKIYEACSFQDITGQRITKVIKALKDIEDRVDSLVAAFGDEITQYKKDNPKKDKEEDRPITDEDLLNGPQNEGDAKTQAEIDALLASFD